MNKKKLFKFLKEQDVSVLLGLLEHAYGEMDTRQQRFVFGELAKRIKTSPADGKKLLKEIKKFHRDSLAGDYYAPFDINSKNFADIPEETDLWFDLLADFLENSRKLLEHGNHLVALECFQLLYELIFLMEDGEEIVFADELGSWMIPGDEKKYIRAYLSSLGEIAAPEEFAEAALPLIRRDSYQSFANKVYYTAIRAANKDQKTYLKAEVKRQNIKTK